MWRQLREDWFKDSLWPHDGNRIERKHYCSEDQVGDGHEDYQDCCGVPDFHTIKILGQLGASVHLH